MLTVILIVYGIPMHTAYPLTWEALPFSYMIENKDDMDDELQRTLYEPLAFKLSFWVGVYMMLIFLQAS